MRLGLWLKLTAAFVLAALVPVATTAWIARQVVGRRYEREHAKALSEIHGAVRQEVEGVSGELARKVSLLAQDSDPKIGRVLLELARGRLPADLRRELDEEGPERMRHLGFDVLLLVDGRGRVLSAGHAPGRVGLKDPLPARLVAAHEGEAVYVRLPLEVRQGNQLRLEERPVLVVGRRVKGPGTQVIVVGGVLVERALWDRLPRRPGVAYLLREGGGRLVQAPPEGWGLWERTPQRRVTLHGLGPETGAKTPSGAELVVAVSDSELRASRQRLDLVIMALAGSAFLFVVLVVGALVVRRVTGRLSKVAVAAGAVAEGDLTVTLPPGPADEVGDLVRAFNRMTSDLREARESLLRAERIAAWQDIARRIAHEIKNPLTPIQLSIETLRRAHRAGRKDFEEILEESTATILEEVQRLRRIVTEFSQFARMPKPTLGPCELNEVIRAAVTLYEGESLLVKTDLAAGLPEVDADREQLMQVLHNLLANARDATRATSSPEVRVVSYRLTHGVGFTVEDNGHGFDATVREQIFTPYFTTKAESGTGLGLAIVHRIVVEHGGTIEVSGAPGRGARFAVSLPLRAPSET
ncbi:MAG: ATP-binding protein [Polyangia bacterium]|jgi:signal transduction histidine kinase|nr:ATP-binding protein [Polyangia bacterium]